MNLLRIKWENIITILAIIILSIMTINFFKVNGFDFNVLMFEILYAGLPIILLRWSFKVSRRFFLQA